MRFGAYPFIASSTVRVVMAAVFGMGLLAPLAWPGRIGLVEPGVALALACTTPSFNVSTISLGAAPVSPYSVVVRDFNGGGVLDIAVATADRDEVGVLLGNGSGGFGSPSQFDITGAFPDALAVGDFNGGGALDLASANALDGTVSVLVGNGSGSFSLAVNFPVGGASESLVAGDFDGDGKADLAVAVGDAGIVSIQRQWNGSGFGAAAPLPFSFSDPAFVTTGNFDSGTNLDLVVADHFASTVSIWLGNGAGGFSGPTQYTVGSGPRSIAVADFNQDGKSDLAVANDGDDTVSILLGNGNGTFAVQPTVLSSGLDPFSVVAADFSGDGNPDLAVVNSGGAPGSVTFFLGNGNGTFQPPSAPFSVGSFPVSAAAGTFDADAKIDLVVANADSDTLSVFINSCVPPTVTPMPTQTTAPSRTPTMTLSPTPTCIPTPTRTQTPTRTPTSTRVPTRTRDPSGARPPTATRVPTSTATPTPVDPSAPSITYNLCAQPNEAGWNRSAAKIWWQIDDEDSGIKSTKGCGSVVVSRTRTVTCTAVNGGGVSASAGALVNLDTSRPTAKVSVRPGLYLVAEGGTKDLVITPRDRGSGLSSCTYEAENGLMGDCGTLALGPGTWNLIVTAIDAADNRFSSSGRYRVVEVVGPAEPLTMQVGGSAAVSFQLSDGAQTTNLTGSVCAGSICAPFAWNASSGAYVATLSNRRLVPRTYSLLVKVTGAMPRQFNIGALAVSR